MKLLVLGEGFTLKGKLMHLCWNCLICGTRAQAFVKCVKANCHYFACAKCEGEEKYLDHTRKFIVVPLNCRKRTDYSFTAQSQKEHHTGVSALLELGIDLVKSVLLDCRHVVCVGVIKKLIVEFYTTTKLSKTSLPCAAKCRISDQGPVSDVHVNRSSLL